MKYAELIKALRETDFGYVCEYCEHEDMCRNNDCVIIQAADALEAADKRIDVLQKLVDINTERCEALRKQLREANESYDKWIAEHEEIVETMKSVTKKRKYYRKCGICGERHEQSEMIRDNGSPNGWLCMDCHIDRHTEWYL